MAGADTLRWGGVLLALTGIAFLSPDGCRAQEAGAGNPRAGLATVSTSTPSAGTGASEGAFSILLPIGARAIGLARAVSAIRGSESAFWNPAGLARINENRFVVLRASHLPIEATALSLILARQPLGTLAISYQLLDFPESDFTDDDANTIGTIFNRHHLGIVSFATRLLPWLDTGLNFKVFQAKTTCRGECTSGAAGTTYLMDAGLLAEPLEELPLRIGLMVAHAGPNLQIINVEQADPPPTRLRVAVGYEILGHFVDQPDIELWIYTEVEDRLRELGSTVSYLGAEFVAGQGDQIFVRAGFGQGQSGMPAGAAMGFGMKYREFRVGIAKTLGSLTSDSEPVHVTFGVRF